MRKLRFSDESLLRAILVTLASVAGCADQVPPRLVVAQVNQDVLAGIDRTRTRVAAGDLKKLEPAFRLELPDEEGLAFRMRNSVALKAFGAPDCTVLVGDASDMAIHWFGGLRAEYVRSVFPRRS